MRALLDVLAWDTRSEGLDDWREWGHQDYTFERESAVTSTVRLGYARGRM